VAKPTRILTAFGEDLDSLLKRAGGTTLREYADQCSISYKYLSQLRTQTRRKPGRLYPDLLKPFTRLGLLDIDEGHRLSMRHRGRLLSLPECRELFPDTPEEEILRTFRRASESEFQPVTDMRPNNKTGQRTIPDSLPRAPLFRKVFVGRQTELNALKLAFDSATVGEPSLVMVSGEAGIGKTTLCRQLSSYVASRGGIIFVGHCNESESSSLPYMAFVELLRPYILGRKTTELARELGDGARYMARIIPEVAAKLGIRIKVGKDPVVEKYRLFQAITDFLARIAEVKPLLLVLEDLHGANHGTLEILQHVPRNFDHKKILIVGTYRDMEVNRDHPLSMVLAELRRLPSFSHLRLHGLNVDEVSRMLSGIFGRDTPQEVSAAVHERTEGNPLFVEEVAHYFMEEGLIGDNGELKRVILILAAGMKIPAGLRSFIAMHLSSLNEQCRQTLSVAAVIGREFRPDILEKVTDMPPEQLIQTIREAIEAAVVEERTRMGVVFYRFMHAFFRQTLYEGMMAPRRIRLHQQTARVLEGLYMSHPQEYAAEMAEHFSQSTEPEDLEKAVFYSEMAAQQASGLFAYRDAAKLLEQAIRLQRILDPNGATKICDLQLQLCDNLLEIPDTGPIYGLVAPEAYSLAESLGDSQRAVRACRAALFALWTEQGSRAYNAPRWGEWAGRVDRWAIPETIERVLADWAGGMTKSVQGDSKTARRLWMRSYALASRLNDPLILSLTGIVHIICLSAPQHIAQRLRVAWKLWEKLRPALTVRSAFHLLVYIGDTFLSAGEREPAEEVFSVLRDIAFKSGNARIGFDSMSMGLVFSVIDGRLEESIGIAEGILARSQEVGIPSSGDFAGVALVRLSTYVGLPVQLVLSRIPPMLARSSELIGLAYSDDVEQARKFLESLLSFRFKLGGDAFAYYDVAILEAAVLIGHKKAAEFAFRRFNGKGVITSGIYWPTCIARHLGGAAALLGRYDQARRQYEEAVRICTGMRFRPELALSRFQLAELLLEHYPGEKQKALEHLNFANKEFLEMKMRPNLERALRYKAQLSE
jgi:tetratricopeptide (TPR) repeat protein